MSILQKAVKLEAARAQSAEQRELAEKEKARRELRWKVMQQKAKAEAKQSHNFKLYVLAREEEYLPEVQEEFGFKPNPDKKPESSRYKCGEKRHYVFKRLDCDRLANAALKVVGSIETFEVDNTNTVPVRGRSEVVYKAAALLREKHGRKLPFNVAKDGDTFFFQFILS